MLEDFNRLEVLVWETLVTNYHQDEGKLFEGSKQIYSHDIILYVEPTYGLPKGRCIEIVNLFLDELGVTDYYRIKPLSAEEELTALLTEELSNQIDRDILNSLRNLETDRSWVVQTGPIPEVDIALEEVYVQRQVRPLRASLRRARDSIRDIDNETRDTGDG